MLPVLFGLVGAVLGAWASPTATALLGFMLGLLWNRLLELSDREQALKADVRNLQTQQESLQRELRDLRAPAPPPPPAPPREEAPRPAVAAPISPVAPPPPSPPPPPPFEPERSVRPPAGEEAVARTRRVVHDPASKAAAADWSLPAPGWLVEFFTTGNIVAKIGMIIVFFGVAFLVRYAADRGLLPIEYRLMATVAGALVLLGFGWRLRRSRRDYAMVLQGGAIGLLYLTIFAAFRLYELLPATLTFALLLLVVVLSAVLAVLQDALSLAALGTSGGFLAPILASTGAGSHVGLFSYYAVLNVGVLGIAWFRSWRFLNWLAFVFTFGIGFVWGQSNYRPELFPTTEPFLVGFFLMFLVLSVLFAQRQPPELRGYVDGSLVFGLPAIAFGLQSVLVRPYAFGRAYSAVALSALYLGLARGLWRRESALRPLAEAFLAVAVVFLVLAVPLAFDGHATAAAWALEGTGLVWIGIRQHRLLARLAGSALLLGAGLAFAAMAAPAPGALPILNARFLGSIAIAAGSITAARLWSKLGRPAHDLERVFEWLLLAWGLMWWFGSTFAEIERHVGMRYLLAAMLIGGAASICLFAAVARGLSWRALTIAVIPMGPLLWLWILPAFVMSADEGPLTDLGWLAWPSVIASSYLATRWFEASWPPAVARVWHAGTTWLLIFLATWAAAATVGDLLAEAATWSSTVWCLVPVLATFLLLRSGRSRIEWPLQRHASLYAGPIAVAPVVAGLVWVAWACARAGSPEPLAYVPLINPLELTQAFALLAAFAWWKRHRRAEGSIGVAFPLVLAALAFVALNMVVGRMVHVYLGVPFDLDALLDSYVFQAGISILWGVTAGGLMTVARLRLDRAVWMAGAALLALLIVKLFLVDLGNVGGIARIVSFLATGVLILVIGYFAPVPPRTEQAT